MEERTLRRKTREEAVIYIYQCLLLKKDIKKHLYEQLGNEISPYLYNLTIDVFKYKDSFIEEISELIINGWSFERLGYLEQAILLMGYAELAFDLNPKNEVVFDVVEIAKKYCDANAYKLINGILG